MTKKSILIVFIMSLIVSSLQAQTPCENGMAGIYPCSEYDLLSFLSLDDMGAGRGNDSWGWTDPEDGKEYAIAGLNNGTAFIDISDPLNPIYLGKLPASGAPSTWRDMKTYMNHVFIVSEASNHGLQIFDLTRLRDVSSPPEIFTEDAHYNFSNGRAHNIAINEDTGYAYLLGTGLYNGGPVFLNIADPLNPIEEGGYAMDGYSHDAHIVSYTGPDATYQGREICIASNETEVTIVDITDKGNPQGISTVAYANVAYTHQGWLTEDHSYFLLGDEADEIDFGFNTRTIVFDISDLDNPEFSFNYDGTTFATDHNGYVKGSKFYISNNSAGLRVIDISDIENGNFVETSYFDSFPPHNDAGYIGAWNVYPYFESGIIAINDREGFFLVKDPALSVEDNDLASFEMIPNPASDVLTIRSKETIINTLQLMDLNGRVLISEKNINLEYIQLDVTGLKSGFYFVTINHNKTKKVAIR